MANYKSEYLERHLAEMINTFSGGPKAPELCMVCGSGKIKSSNFRNREAWQEYEDNKICQSCQDDMFDYSGNEE